MLVVKVPPADASTTVISSGELHLKTVTVLFGSKVSDSALGILALNAITFSEYDPVADSKASRLLVKLRRDIPSAIYKRKSTNKLRMIPVVLTKPPNWSIDLVVL
jgi:hypothetical protein